MRKLIPTTTPRLLLAAFLLLAAGAAMAQERARIVAVNYPLAYFAERLAGDAAEVIYPVPESVDPSFWRPAIADISTVQSADLILLNGAGFATWVDRVSLPRSKLVNSSDGLSDRFISTQSITHSHGDGGEHSHEGTAAYTWLDPDLAIAQAEAVARAMTARGLAPADAVQDRLDALRSELETLDAAAGDALADAGTVPMIATHPRYQYLARAYGLDIAALDWDAGATPDADQLQALSDLAAERGARILIWEADPGAEAMTATDELGLTSVVFPPLATPPEDGSYLEAFRAAVTALGTAATP
ncbi:metal ABC transporter substrate-binding protein [Pseudoponticoccus marisrubri]|uniref:High-affinity zinc uptake system protein ZnuA n=1 Tax=Pseudoponticoccus marisrubri TaxID=1685382 RepID=A0A0W7WIB1_9RHOB|nr:metal ABC transporter substrate-binding protein [Pseudoponticoccus marisrubri]KUF10246.1 hypothetical protein AVJ23_12605 [Pseudoponticoccus marisrubri]